MTIILKPLELCTCYSVWIFGSVYLIYKLYQSQSEILYDDPVLTDIMSERFSPGWRLLARSKDTSDLAWRTFKYYIQTWAYLIVQSMITEIIRKTEVCHLKYWYIISSMIFIDLYMGYKLLLFTLIQPLLYAAILFCGGKKWSIWIASIGQLAYFSSSRHIQLLSSLLNNDNTNDKTLSLILIMISMAWNITRCTSYSLDYIESSKGSSKRSTKIESLVDMMSYSLYAPLLYTGPLILYEDFKTHFSKPTEKLAIRLKRFIIEMCIFLTYTFLLDWALHYIYFNAMCVDMQKIRKIPTLALTGGMVWMGAKFYVKYVIIYGTASAFARLDNMETPPTPRCVLRIHVFTQMWRYFDVGLYRFLVKYIYRPSFDWITTWCKLPKIVNKMMASFATFIFIFIWHGSNRPILVWSILNYLGINLEQFCKVLSETNRYKWFKKNVLVTDTMETRFVAFLCVPLYFMSLASSTYFLTNTTEVGNYYFEHFYNQLYINWNITILHYLLLYCICVVSMDLQDVPSRPYFKTGNEKGPTGCPMNKQSAHERVKA